MTYWTPITPISNKLRLVDLLGNDISEEQKRHFRSFENHLIDVYKEGNLIFVYRGESLKGLQKKLFLNHGEYTKSRLYERLFIIGDKARYFFMDKANSNDRGWLTSINDRSDATFGFIFERIANVLSTPNLEPRIQQSCSSRFLSYFCDSSNREKFIATVEATTQHREQDRLKLRDYYLYFLHVAGSAGVRKETMLVSTSLSAEISEEKFTDQNSKYSLVLYGFIPQPYHNFIVSPWLASEYHRIASEKEMPTYQPFGLFPEQLEISVKGALFSCFLMGVKQVEDDSFVVNPHIFSANDLDQASKYGIPVNQDDFMNSVLASGYMRFFYTDLQGNFEQCEISR